MTRPFGEEGDTFKFSLFIVLCNRLVTCMLAVGCLLVSPLSSAPLVNVRSMLHKICLQSVVCRLQTYRK